jgi:hypothetical protein
MKSNIYSKIMSLFIAFCLVLVAYKFIKHEKEGFTPKIRQIYRPYLRHINTRIETFTNNYNLSRFINSLRKWNLY